jgi:transposase-like protein
MKVIGNQPRTDAALHEFCQSLPITIKDLAKELKISYNILYAWWRTSEKRPILSDTNQKKVENWAKKLGYTPTQEETKII